MRYDFKAPKWAGWNWRADGKTGASALERQGCLTNNPRRAAALLYAAECRAVSLASEAGDGFEYARLTAQAERCYSRRLSVYAARGT